MFRFAHPEYLYLLLLVPVLIGFFYMSLRQKSKRLTCLGDKDLLLHLMPKVSHWRPRVRFMLCLLVFVLCVFALARPQAGAKLEKVKRQGIEVMVAVDVSNSMLATDLAPSRMSRAKQILSRLIDYLHNDKVGLLVFAGDSYVQMPMTTDVSSAKMFLSNISPGMVPVQGTAIGSAIRMSMGLFSRQEGMSRTIIIITDGENHEDDAVAAAKMARENGVTVNVLGVGTAKGSPIPITGTQSYRKDRDGNVVVTKLNESMCQEIAEAGGGMYVRADNAATAARSLTKELDQLAKADLEGQVYTEYEDQYLSLAVIALGLLLVAICLMNSKNPLFKNVRLF